jgi:hypothetical protein
MISFKFEIDGQPVTPGNMGDALEHAMLRRVEENLRERIGSIRDPDTGEFPTMVVQGTSLSDLSIRVEGSEKLIALIHNRLNGEDQPDEEVRLTQPKSPKAFLSFTWLDQSLAEMIAKALMASGIDTFWAPWCIGPGDSLRQKIEEGLSDCTHFIVLLTPNSIDKPWVNQEMDAGLILKLNEGRKFIALRHNLSPAQLPKLLVGSLAPEVSPENLDVTELVNGIWGITSKPPLGQAPAAVADARSLKSGYSAAATAIAKVFVQASEHGLYGDPQMRIEQLMEATGLPRDDIEDGLHELSGMAKVHLETVVLVEPELYAVFDKYWHPWDPAQDARRLAADLVNDNQFPTFSATIAERYGWLPRRLNPAVAYLTSRRLLRDLAAIESQPWLRLHVYTTADTRRFVKSL